MQEDYSCIQTNIQAENLFSQLEYKNKEAMQEKSIK